MSNYFVLLNFPKCSIGCCSRAQSYPVEETETTRNMDISALRQEQQRIIEGLFVIYVPPHTSNYVIFNYSEQDRGLEALSNALRRQKKMGQQIGEEVEYQTGEVMVSGWVRSQVHVYTFRIDRRLGY